MNRESQNNQNESRKIKEGEKRSTTNDETILLSSPTQQQMMDQNKSKDHWTFAFENPIVPKEFLELSTINDDVLY